MSSKLKQLASDIGKLLKEKQLTLCTAESCTAGGISFWVTSLPGSSQWFDCGFVTYSNQAKMDLLGVNAATLSKHGAVSAETALEMAEGALKNSRADISLAITGIAGPGGGSVDKPVGTVWLAFAAKITTPKASLFQFKGDRASVREQSIEQALGLLKEYLMS